MDLFNSRHGSLNTRIAAVLAFAILTLTANAQSPFLRLQKPGGTQEVLQTKARKYTPANGKGPAVWLVGVAHVGKPGYYKDLQKLLDEQTTVLYEGVSRQGVDPIKQAKATPPPKDANASKSTYQVLSDTLGLQFQLQGIDYTRKSFHSSDLSWEELSAIEAKAPKAKAGSPSLSSVGNMLDGNSEQGKMFANLMTSIKDDPGSLEGMRLMMVEMLSDPNAFEMVMSPGLNDLLIKTRNAHVLGDLKKEMITAPNTGSIAIFYGAGHMGDFEKHLTADFGYKPGEERWFSALQGDESKVDGMGKMILQAARAQLKARKSGGR